ncbi:MAG: DUF4412 domain-containing protein [Acidobacteria bacterium]|nr:DUF4412 domain-containing protein [Acidobacteriota bacterium]MCL5288939.1 DUF4412 domain-containing protein [Acidobacteriota bacterium]
MKRFWNVVVLFVLGVIAFPQVGMAQMGMGMKGPSMRGVWKPAVGSGAAYQMESKREGKREMEVAIVGAETSEGKPGHWMEMVVQSEEGPMVMRTLLAMDGKELRTLRMVVQPGNEEPMEISMEMMGMMGQQQKPQKSDVRDEAERVGTETITTPAGTFECEHWRAKDKSADFWVTDKVSPWGMVKMTSKDETMTLVRVISNAKTKIRGTPRKMEDMMRRP